MKAKTKVLFTLLAMLLLACLLAACSPSDTPSRQTTVQTTAKDGNNDTTGSDTSGNPGGTETGDGTVTGDGDGNGSGTQTPTLSECEKNGHTEVVDQAVAATCNRPGLTEGKHCSVCHEILVAQTEIPKLAHTEVIDPAVAATCSKTGLTEGKHCSVCHEVIVAQTLIPVNGHHYVKGICTACNRVWSSEGLHFELDSSETGYCLVGIGTCSDTNIIIPSEYNGKPVTSIDSDAFSAIRCSDIRSITVPDSVTSIGGGAFYGCSSIRSITLPFVGETKDGSSSNTEFDFVFDKNVPATLTTVVITGSTHIANYAFENCSGITSITLPNSVTDIGNYAFKNCTNLKNITIPDSVTSIGEGAFSGCKKLENMTLPFIGANANASSDTYRYPFGYIFGTIAFSEGTATEQYYYAPNTTSQTKAKYYIPSSLNSVTVTGGTINEGAFYNCSGITSITIPNSVTSIGYQAFRGCTSLASITIPDSVTSIGEGAFYGCNSLTSITIPFVGGTKDGTSNTSFKYIFGNSVPSSLKTVVITGGSKIANEAFYWCGSLTSITLPNSVTDIGNYAFKNCTGLKNITLPDGVTSIGYDAFYNCSSLTSITIPDSVKSIGSYAFSYCTSLASITIPDSVKSIGYNAFYNCSSLTSITIPNSVTYIGSSAFSGCSNLTSITIPDSVTSIGEEAFSGCTSLTSITIPNSVTSIGSSAFSGCTSLASMTLPFVGGSATNKTFFGYIFGADSYANNTSYVPSSLKSVTITYVTSIGDGSFYGCSSLTSVTIGNSVTSIGSSAFRNCSSLTSVTIGNSVTSIGYYAFYECTSLTSMTIGNSVTSIGYDAFYNCSSLTNVVIGNSVTSIGNWAFYGCTSLASVTIPDSVTSIGDHAFYGCSHLTYNTHDNANYLGNEQNPYFALIKATDTSITSCEIHSQTKIIADYAFEDCKELTSITIPNSVTNIGSHAFSYCTSLASVTIPDSVTGIGYDAFYNCSSLTYNTYGAANYLGNAQNPYFALIKATSTSIISCKIHPQTNVIAGSAFYECSKLTSVYITDLAKWCQISFSYYYSNPLYYAHNLYLNGTLVTDLVIPNSVTSIGKSAFSGCNMTSITIPDSVTSIGENAFYSCNHLTSITFTGTQAEWNAITKGTKWNYNCPATVVCTG